ncbi:MAG: hypothetical protein KAG64_00295 [Bacteroidales bacterium]|nr:hypothetical protein [Bacteroidales bacterium]
MNYLKHSSFIAGLFLLIFSNSFEGFAQGLAFQSNSYLESYSPAVIEFLDIEKGSIAILDESYEPYFSKLQFREVYALIGTPPPSGNIDEVRNYARDKFSSAVATFTEKEKSAISYVISVVKRTFSENKLELIASHPWKFIKIENWLCGGFAHTRGEYIILSQRHLDHLISNWSDNMTQTDSFLVAKKLGSLLIHEQFHSLQRYHPPKFDSLYINSWQFKKAEIEVDSTILLNQLTNPDAPKPEWIFKIKNDYYWARTLIDEKPLKPVMGRDFKDVAFSLISENGTFKIAKDSLNKNIVHKLSDFSEYINSFPVAMGLDHPNEISAYMISEYYISLLAKEIPFKDASQESNIFAEEFVLWLNRSFN